MYEVFDEYLSSPHWHGGAEEDLVRFNVALAKVVEEPNFRPDRMGDYMKDQTLNEDEDLLRVITDEIETRVADAWAVQDYLRCQAGLPTVRLISS